METIFEIIHNKMVAVHNKAIDLTEKSSEYKSLMSKAQAYADILDLINKDFKFIKNVVSDKHI